MGFHQLIRHQHIPASPETVWSFICRPENLREITPDYMGFEILTPDLPEVMYPGMIIAYKVRPVAGIPLTWVTEITQVAEGRYFVDEQRVGPYALWPRPCPPRAPPAALHLRLPGPRRGEAVRPV